MDEQEFKLPPIKKCSGECGSYYKEKQVKNKDGTIRIVRRHVSRPWRDENGKVIWKNLLLPDGQSMILMLIVMGLFFGYKADIAHYQDIIEKPRTYCCNALQYNGYISPNVCDSVFNRSQDYLVQFPDTNQ